MTDPISSLISRLTLEEKAGLCSGLDSWHTKPVERLGIPAVRMSDGPHGLRKEIPNAGGLGEHPSLPATCFPTASALACTWDRELVGNVGKALGVECQAGQVDIILGPGANIKRLPQCGRNFEYYSEDPYLSSEMVAGFIRGVQGQGVGTSLKHFAANNQETGRMSVDSVIDERTLHEIYLASFEGAVRQANPWTVMCAYNRLNGPYCSQNAPLLTGILRDGWGYDGVVVSDWGAVDERVPGLAAGLDLEMPSSNGVNDRRIVAAVRSGQLPEAVLDRAVERVLRLVFRCVEGRRPGVTADLDAHYRLARQAAREAAVLLKNDGQVLPLQPEGTLAVLGALASRPKIQGGGSSRVRPARLDDPVAELAATGAKVTYRPGYRLEDETVDAGLVDEAVSAARGADHVVLFAGLPDGYEAEGFDRPTLALPPNQVQLIEAVAAVRPDLTVVLLAGAPVTLPWLERVSAVLLVHAGGEALGGAVADLLLGAGNPCGKLAETWPQVLEHNPTSTYFPSEHKRAEYREGVFVGYRYYDRKRLSPLFPFGHGQSYTSFAYTGLTLSRDAIRDDEPLTASVTVRNTGARAGKEVVELYVRDVTSSVPRPEKELKGFAKVELQPGEERTVTLTLDKRSFAYYDTGLHGWLVESGAFEIQAGGSSRDLPLRATVTVTSTTVRRPRFDRNSTLGDLLADPDGAAVAQPILQGIQARLSAASATPGAALGVDVMEMLRTLPLRTLAAVSEGTLTKEAVERMIEELNKGRA